MRKVEMVARWFINKMQPTPLKLQKLLYFAQGTHFAFNDKELFPDDFEGWVHGPVVKSIYNEYKIYGSSPITINYVEPKFNQEDLDTLQEVERIYGKYDGKELEKISHSQAPWQYARRGLDADENIDKTIPKYIIADYFTSQMYMPV